MKNTQWLTGVCYRYEMKEQLIPHPRITGMQGWCGAPHIWGFLHVRLYMCFSFLHRFNVIDAHLSEWWKCVLVQVYARDLRADTVTWINTELSTHAVSSGLPFDSCDSPPSAYKAHRPVCLEKANVLDQRNFHQDSVAPDPQVTVSCRIPGGVAGAGSMTLPRTMYRLHKILKTALPINFVKISPSLP